MKIVKDAKELGIGEVMAYLTRQYGIPDTDVRMLAVEGQVGQPLLITVTVYAQVEPREVAVDLSPDQEAFLAANNPPKITTS